MYPSNKKKKVWREEKERLLKMTLEERRKEYLRDYVPLSTILSWKEEMKSKSQSNENPFGMLVETALKLKITWGRIIIFTIFSLSVNEYGCISNVGEVVEKEVGENLRVLAWNKFCKESLTAWAVRKDALYPNLSSSQF